jgi:hypothetical protein
MKFYQFLSNFEIFITKFDDSKKGQKKAKKSNFDRKKGVFLRFFHFQLRKKVARIKTGQKRAKMEGKFRSILGKKGEKWLKKDPKKQ